ncbi:DUF881 domain-containing protein [Cellulomonas sp. HZM]|uniref:DUF881 domain-containing protein n=1 Tax=Cellulomonas sp. HZM TaxID=1454010 RepID=UPI00068BE5DB|nr:DUF881 domain-containing protein [Cellulomonas sp. HZM]
MSSENGASDEPVDQDRPATGGESDVTEEVTAEDEPADVPAVDGPGADDPGADDPRADDPRADDGPVVEQVEPSDGWPRLWQALRPRATRAQVLAGLLCAALGFALVVQVRQTNDASLSGLRQADLVRILDETTARGDALAKEVDDLRDQRDQLASGSDKQQAALDALRRSAETQGILTGRLPAQGSGVVVTLTEPSGEIKPATMLNMLEELRNAGAEAIDLNGERITASSAFAGVPGAVTLDGTVLHAPFVWTAIGDPDTIATALQIPGGALATVRSNGGEGTVQRRDEVEIRSVRELDEPRFATPSPAAAG